MNGTHIHDIVVIGGGIGGCGIARDAADRDFDVLLSQRDGRATGTSLAGTKPISRRLRPNWLLRLGQLISGRLASLTPRALAIVG